MADEIKFNPFLKNSVPIDKKDMLDDFNVSNLNENSSTETSNSIFSNSYTNFQIATKSNDEEILEILNEVKNDNPENKNEITYDETIIQAYSQLFGIDENELKIQLENENSYYNNVFSLLNGANGEINNETIQAFTIFSLQEIYTNLDTAFDSQLDSEGAISDCWNWINETFGISVSREDMQLALEIQKESISLLIQAYNGELSADKLIEQQKKILELSGSKGTREKINSIIQSSLNELAINPNEPVSFEDAFKCLFGKEFNPDDIIDYSQKYQNYLSVQDGAAQIDQISNVIKQSKTYDEAMYYFKVLYGDKAEEYMQEYMQRFSENAEYNQYGIPCEYEKPNYEDWGDIMLCQENYTTFLEQTPNPFKNEFSASNLNIDVNLFVERANNAENYNELLTIYNEAFGEDKGKMLLDRFVCDYWTNPNIQENPVFFDNFSYVNIYANQNSDFFMDKFDEELIKVTGKSISEYQDEYVISYAKAFSEFNETESDLKTYISNQQTAVGIAKSTAVVAALTAATVTGGGSLALPAAIGYGAGAQVASGILESATSENGVTVQGVASDAFGGGFAGLTYFANTTIWKSIYSKLANSRPILHLGNNTNTALTTQSATSNIPEVTSKFALNSKFGGFAYGNINGIPVVAGYITPKGASVIASMSSGFAIGSTNGEVNYLLNSDELTLGGFLKAGAQGGYAGAISGGITSLLVIGIQDIISQPKINYTPTTTSNGTNSNTSLSLANTQTELIQSQQPAGMMNTKVVADIVGSTGILGSAKPTETFNPMANLSLKDILRMKKYGQNDPFLFKLCDDIESEDLNPEENYGIVRKLVLRKSDENGNCIKEEITYLGCDSKDKFITYTQLIDYIYKDEKQIQSNVNLYINNQKAETYTIKGRKNAEATPTQIYQVQRVREVWAQQIYEDLIGDFEASYGQFTQLFGTDSAGIELAQDVNGLRRENNDISSITGNIMYGRSKSALSLGDKIVRKILKQGANIPDKEAAKALVEDAIGTRLILDNPKGDTQIITDRLCSEIKAGNITITQIHNYHGLDTTGYFTDEQIKQINDAATEKRNRDKDSGIDISDLKDIAVVTGSDKKAIKEGGYTALHINVKYKNGALGEIQIRGKMIEQISEIEHIVYDIEQGKNVDKKYEEVRKIILGLSKKEKELYKEYWQKMFKYGKDMELKIPCEKPVLQLPEEISQKLSFEGLLKLKQN